MVHGYEQPPAAAPNNTNVTLPSYVWPLKNLHLPKGKACKASNLKDLVPNSGGSFQFSCNAE